MHYHPSQQQQQQQQLAVLLASVVPPAPTSSSTFPPHSSSSSSCSSSSTLTSSSSSSSVDGSSSLDEVSRITALSSLHHAILHPQSLLLLQQSSSFLCQALVQLLSDKSYSVRHAAAIAFGALGAVTVSANGHSHMSLPGACADRFLGWALPQISDFNSNSETALLPLAGLLEFLSEGDTIAIERYVPSILRACQAVLENEGTSLSLLRPLLGIFTNLGIRFSQIFQPCFADLVDLLLGWALMPDLSESDRHLIMDSFLQFQKFWAGNLTFSLSLLSKLLGDMEVLAQDAAPATPEQLQRLLALALCFVAVLQAMASGIHELGLVDEALEPLQEMLPYLLSCLTTVGKKFRTYKWMEEAFRCLLVVASLLKERFVGHYSLVLDFLFQSLGLEDTSEDIENGSVIRLASSLWSCLLTSNQVHSLLKINLQLITLQGLSLLPSAVQKLIAVGSLFPCLRLHPSCQVTGVVSATYLVLLQHGSEQVMYKACSSIYEELDHLKFCLSGIHQKVQKQSDAIVNDMKNQNVSMHIKIPLLEREAAELIKFDLVVLTGSVCSDNSLGIAAFFSGSVGYRLSMLKELGRVLLEKLSPFEDPIQCYPDVQFAIIRALHRLCCFEGKGCQAASDDLGRVRCSSHINIGLKTSVAETAKYFAATYTTCLATYGSTIAKCLCSCSSLSVKLEGLDWLNTLCKIAINVNNISSHALKDFPAKRDPEDMEKVNPVIECACLSMSIVSALLGAVSDREKKVRSHVAMTIGLLLQANLIDTSHFLAVVAVLLEQLGDPDPVLQSAFRGLLALVTPAALWIYGLVHNSCDWKCQFIESSSTGKMAQVPWRQVFAINSFSPYLRSQQLVCILTYIAQRWQAIPSNWLQRLVLNFPRSLNLASSKLVEEKLSTQGPGPANINKGDSISMGFDVDADMVQRVCTTNNLAAAWLAIQEAARHCVTVRLRTHLGGPTQTFAVLERMLVDVVHLLQTDYRQMETGGGVASSKVQLLPMRLLLEFVEALKKNIYNAYEGSIVFSTPPASSIHFFRANRKVCEEWFARIGEALMNACLAQQCHSGTFHHAVSHLQNLRGVAASTMREVSWTQITDNVSTLKLKVQQDVLRTLQHASLALCRMHEGDAITGLQMWALSTFGSLLLEDGKTNSLFGPLVWMPGLVLQAQGQYESAADYFMHQLQSEETLGVLGADGVQFIIARTLESYVALADWDSLDCWLQDLHALRAKHAGKPYAGALTTAGNDMNAIHALARFDAGDVQGAWGFLDLTPQNNSDLTADPRLALQRSEQMLLQAMLHADIVNDENVIREVETSKAMLYEALLVSGIDGLSDAIPYIIQLHCIGVFESKHKHHDDISGWPHLSLHSTFQQIVCLRLNALHQDCLLWLKLLRVYRKVLPDSEVSLQLQQQLMRLARKQHNFKLAHRLLNGVPVADSSLCQYGAQKGRVGDILMGFEYERILLQFAEEKHEEAILELWKIVHSCLSSHPCHATVEYTHAMKAKACLKLSSWLKQKYSFSFLPSFLSSLHSEAEADDVNGTFIVPDRNAYARETNWPINSSLEEVVGATVKTATVLCPDMAKAWYAYASWCYNLAKASLSGNAVVKKPSLFPDILEAELPLNGSTFSEKELEDIYSIVFDATTYIGSNNGIGTKVNSWLPMKGENTILYEATVKRIIYNMHVATSVVGDGESPAMLLSLQLQKELYTINSSAAASHVTICVNKLMEIWWALRRRRVSLYGHAVRGFLKYLSLSTLKCTWRARNKEFGPGEVNTDRQDFFLRASLYVLQILLTHGVELEDIIENGLLSVPPRPWQEITSQLFARLSSHPESTVRKQLEGLLMTLANVSPWAVVYPTLVDFNACEGEPSRELQRILGCLVNMHPKLVNDVRLFIAELGAITVLWEEQWLSTLQDLHADVTRRITTLKEEAARVAENTTLSHLEKSRINAAKYCAMMAPIAVALERRLASTSKPPETAHEAWFQDLFGAQLKAAISVFKSPPTSTTHLGDVWHPFDAIAASLASQQKKPTVLLDDVAPRLAVLTSSEVPMPGLEKQALTGDSVIENRVGDGGDALSGIVTVTAFDKHVRILATKTKPKKLSMTGSDGQCYTYLLKGREDLRLDARIMQLLRAVNGMLHSCSSTLRRNLTVRYYSVTPISGRAGLIQWVDNVTSMYGVYKAWQQRNQAAQHTTGGIPNGNSSVQHSVARPSDMYYGKIIPALKEKGLRKVISRKDWPLDVKRKVLLELMKETPRQLLYRELWCASAGFVAFSSKQQRFSGSVAVMSIVGYILGLGDRHLDNILIDFSTGEVVHIDYNVCFDKGLRLKIPEIVPFRLTQTIQAALGLTGIEGAFRANCEAVLETMQKNKDLILMLLEVFIWDPLVEWKRGDGHDEATIGGEERKGMELAVSLSLFASRFQEIRVPLQDHHDQLLATLPAMLSTLQGLLEAQKQYERCRDDFLHMRHETFNTNKADVAAISMIAEISAAEKVKLAYDLHVRELSEAKGVSTDAVWKAAQWIDHENLHNASVTEVQGNWQLPIPAESLSLTLAAHTTDDLQTAISSAVDRTVEAATALSAFCRVMKNYSALTTEAGSMLEEVLAITEGAEGAHDVHSLAQEASTEHSKLMSDLSKINVLLLPLESIFVSAKDVLCNLKTISSFSEEKEKVDLAVGHSQSVLRSLSSKIKEIVPVLIAIVPGLVICVKQLHATLTRLARTASLDAGVLHKALEGVGESQEARSQELGLVASGPSGQQLQSPDHVKAFYEQLTELGDNLGESPLLNEESFLEDHEDCWISPPGSSVTSSSDIEVNNVIEGSWIQSEDSPNFAKRQQPFVTSDLGYQKVSGDDVAEFSRLTIHDEKLESASPLLARSQADATLFEEGNAVVEDGTSSTSESGSQILLKERSSQKHDVSHISVNSNTTVADILNLPQIDSLAATCASPCLDHPQVGETLHQTKQEHHQEQVLQSKEIMGSHDTSNTSTLPPAVVEYSSYSSHEKNACAVSVLKRVELKLDGHDVDGKRQLSVAEQVDHLLRQATSIDNLCNMYEGWTPWI